MKMEEDKLQVATPPHIIRGRAGGGKGEEAT